MKNKLLIAALLVSGLFSGCGDSGDSYTVADDADTDGYDSGYEETDSDYEDDTYEYEEETEEIVVGAYPFTKLYPFSDRRAWVNFSKDGVIYTGIIDTEGKILYQAEGEFFYVSPFEDGTAFYRETSEETSPCGIIDLEGNVLFESQITPDGGYLILGYGEGHFFAMQHIENFNTNEWRYGTLDEGGGILNDMQADTDELITYQNWMSREECCSCIKYIGENYIAFPVGLYNVSTGNFSKVQGDVHEDIVTIGDFQDGYTIATTEGGYNSFVISKDYQGPQDAIKIDDSIYIDEYSLYSEGLVWARSWGEDEEYDEKDEDEEEFDEDDDDENDILKVGYYDKDGGLVISMSQYDDENETLRGRPFRGGYAGITMNGADGKLYATVIDKSGNLIYDPIKIDSNESSDSANGYFQVVIDGEKKIISPNGAIYTPGIDDLSELEGIAFGDVCESFIIMNPDDGYSDATPYYVGLDTETIIDSAKVTSTDIDIVEDESWDEEISEETTYIVPDSYDITGKWKSVGESGFGQAQPGAIIIFNGNNCNFYSPNDTYAFYKENDRYVLDITSVLGESLSQTVNIIDDDNIEIAGASLKRIE